MRGHRCQRGRGEEDALADDRVATHVGPLVVGQRPRLLQHAVGDADLADVVQVGGQAHPLALALVQAQAAGHELGQPAHGARVLVEVRMSLVQHAHEQVLAVVGRARAPAVLLGVHPLVGQPQRLGSVPRVGGQQDGAVRSADVEALAALGQRGGRVGQEAVDPARVGQHAELVAAQAVGGAVRARPPRPAHDPGGAAGRPRPGARTCRCRP